MAQCAQHSERMQNQLAQSDDANVGALPRKLEANERATNYEERNRTCGGGDGPRLWLSAFDNNQDRTTKKPPRSGCKSAR